jgi:hypothetical protein
MKISRGLKEAFKPINILITIESEKERKEIRCGINSHFTVNGDDGTVFDDFLNAINDEI